MNQTNNVTQNTTANLDIIRSSKKPTQQENFDPNCLKLLIKLIDFLKIKGDKEIWELFLMQERLIFTSSFLLEKGVEIDQLGFDYTDEIVSFVQKINLKIMEQGDSMKFEEQIQQISRPIDMLLYQPVFKNIRPFNKTLELRILCFNNLSCMYKAQKKYQDALKAIESAIEMERILMNEGNIEAIKNNPSTYINKSVILSEIGQHMESIEALKKALESMELYQKSSESEEDKEEIEQMKYLSVIAYFNLAVEHEHLFYTSYAKTFYETALNISRELGYGEMTRTIETVLKKMGESNANKQKLKQLDLK